MDTLLAPLFGGVLIGLAASVLLLGIGRIAGVSGILGELLPPRRDADSGWRLAFVVGLVFSGLVGAATSPGSVGAPGAGPVALVAAGLLVGLGTRLSNGCTSGHGVCGIGRASPRSLVATATFIVAGMLTVLVVRHGLGQ